MRSVGIVAALVVSTVVPVGTAHAADDWENSPVRAKWQALGGASFAGEKVGDEVVEPGGHARWAKFSKYDIVITWGDTAGAHWMSGAISRKWLSKDDYRSVLAKDQVPVNRGAQAGATVDFENGYSIYYSDAHGAYSISGPERDSFRGRGGVTGLFGWPVSDLLKVNSWGLEQQFSEAVSTYREPERTAHWISGALRDKFREDIAAGRRNWPAGDQTPQPGNGWSIRMNNGAIYWSAATGAHSVDWMVSMYEMSGGPGRFGYPTTDTTAHDGGASTDFANETTFYRNPAGSIHWMSGRIRDEHNANGGLTGSLGWPSSDQYPAPGTDGQYVLFGTMDKVILWGPRTGAHVVRGQFLEKLRAGGDVAVYGLPEHGEMRVGEYDFQQFENASVFVGSVRVMTLGWDFREIWWQTGGTQSPLGMPASDAWEMQPGVFYQEFTTGWIKCDYNSGQCTYGSTGTNAQATTFRVTTSGPRR